MTEGSVFEIKRNDRQGWRGKIYAVSPSPRFLETPLVAYMKQYFVTIPNCKSILEQTLLRSKFLCTLISLTMHGFLTTGGAGVPRSIKKRTRHTIVVKGMTLPLIVLLPPIVPRFALKILITFRARVSSDLFSWFH